MSGRSLVACAASFACGCFATAAPAVAGPLEAEGEIYLQALPLPPEGARLAFQIESIAAVRSDGLEVPLRLAHGTLSRDELRAPRLIAWGRLEPGNWLGFSLAIGKASLRGESGASDLLLAKEPVRVDAPFHVERRHATILELALDYAGSIDRTFGFSPRFSISTPRKPLAQASGFCTNGASHDATVFDKRAHALSAVVPTGSGPWGAAFDPLQNRLYVALAGDDAVQVFDAGSLEELDRIRLQPGDGPRELALTPDRRLLIVANGGSNSVSFVDPIGMLETGRLQVGEVPTSILIDRAGQRAYVFNARSTFISVIDVANRAVSGTVATEYGPLRGQLNRDGSRLYVITSSSAYLTAIALPSLNAVNRVYVGLGTTAIKVDPATDLLYVAQGGAHRLAVFDPFSLVPIDYVEVPGDGAFMAISDAENELYVLMPERRAIAVIELAGKRLVAEIDVGLQPRVLALAGERN